MIESILAQATEEKTPYLESILNSISKLVSGKTSTQELKLIDQSLKELHQSFKVFFPYRDARKVCIFGSARTPAEDPEYLLTETLAAKITEMGYMVITGAGPGIMEAGNKGAEYNKSFGVNIELPFEQEANPYISGSSKLVSYKYFFNRKLIFVRESDATVLLPGGFGTHDELFEVLTLIQNGRCAPRPVVLLSAPGSTYWKSWNQFIRHELLDKNFISECDMEIFTITQSVDEAVAAITHFYSAYHSIRYLRDEAILRLNVAATEAMIDGLNRYFHDVLLDGGFEAFVPTPTELKEINGDDVYADKHYIRFHFNMAHFGRLCPMIQFINSLAGMPVNSGRA
ncbi:MAG: TIGR00730 family Rossman fold protein [Candidatus Margulisiibacteriota bacterium]